MACKGSAVRSRLAPPIKSISYNHPLLLYFTKTLKTLSFVANWLPLVIRFNPSRSSMQFRLRMSDVLEYLLLPGLFNILEKEAPHIRLDITHISPIETILALENDYIDLAISMDLKHSTTIKTQEIFQDRMVCHV